MTHAHMGTRIRAEIQITGHGDLRKHVAAHYGIAPEDVRGDHVVRYQEEVSE